MFDEELWQSFNYDDFAAGKNAIDIKNVGRNINSLYEIVTPFQVTEMRCAGAGADDMLYIRTLAGDRRLTYRQPVALHHAQYRCRNFHFHDYFEILIVLEGSIQQMIEGHEYLYPAGSCCLINRSLVHLEDYTGPARVFFVGLSTALLQKLFAQAETADFPQEKAFLQSDICRFVRRDLQSPGAKAYLDFMPVYGGDGANTLHGLTELILKTLEKPGFGATQLLYGLFSRLLAALADPDCFHCTEVQLSNASDALLFARVQHILQEQNGRIGREGLSDRLHYSGDYINRVVKKHTGQCLFDYAMGFCLKQAADLLLHSDLSITEIAQRLQFTNRSHFYRLFRQKYGMTPKEYRAQGRTAQPET